jgi:hypothetical protein
MYRALGVATAATAIWLVACTGELGGEAPGDGTAGPGEDSSTGDPLEGKLSTNGLVLDVEGLAALDMAALGSWRSSSQAQASSRSLIQLAARPGGLEQVEYLALCALSRGTELAVADSSGAEVRFSGLYGLAPEWVDEECGPSCQRWISACLVSHANAFGQRIQISLRGRHPGLVWDDAIVADYPLQEGAFYGNVFAAVPIAYACAGRALIEFDEDDPTNWHFTEEADRYLTQRICSAGSPCGLENAGLCHVPRGTASACAIDAGEVSYYGACQTADDGPGTGASTIDEVITTYLSRD